MSCQPDAEAATYTIHNKHERQTIMPPAGFEPVIPKIKRIEAHASRLHGHWYQPKSNLFLFLLLLCTAHKHRGNKQIMI
jgi:hypothetical protein